MTPKESERFQKACATMRKHVVAGDELAFETVVQHIIMYELSQYEAKYND